MTQEKMVKFFTVDSKLIIVLLLGCISFTTVTISIPYDLLGYITHALNIVNGNGYTYINGEPVFFRGPVFSLLIAISFQLFGISPESAFYVVRFFCIANPVLIYLLGKKVFSAKIGFAAALFLLSSYSISFWSYRLIDASWPFFVILHCYLLYEGFESRKTYLFVFAGVSLGIAYLTKEVALLFFPLSVLMILWIKQYQNKKNMVGVAVGLIATFLVLLPWISYLHHHHALHFLWGTGGPVVLDDISNSIHTGDRGQTLSFFLNLFAAVKEYGAAFIYFYSGQKNTVSANFIIAPLYLPAWLYVLVKSFLGDKGSKILILNVLLFLPIICFIGKNHWRFGQVLFIMLLSSIALAYFLSGLVDWFCRVSKASVPVSWTIFFCTVLLLVTVQIFAHSNKDLGYANFFKKTKLYHLIHGESTQLVVTGPYFYPEFNKTTEKLIANIDANEPLLVDSLWLARRLFLELKGERKIYGFPMVWVRNNKIIRGRFPKKNGERALFLTANNLPLEPQYRFYILFESQLIDMLHSKKLHYVILSRRFGELEVYFSRSENYEEVLRLGANKVDEKIHYLYRVKEDTSVEGDFPVLYKDLLVLTLDKLRKNDPQSYRFIRDNTLYKIASLSEEDVTLMLESLKTIPLYQIELGTQYREAGKIEQALEAYKEALRLDPENKKTMQLLADFYREEGMPDEAIKIYLRLNNVIPDNVNNHLKLGELYKGKGKVAKAIKEYKQAVSLLPEYWYFRHFLGEMYLQSGLVDEAIEQYTKLVELRPDFAMYSRLLGDLHKSKGMKAEALVQYKKALHVVPDSTYFQQLIDDLEHNPDPLENP